MYMERRRNRRVDRLIYILVHDVETDYKLNTQRVSIDIGRMGPVACERRKRMIAAENISGNLFESMIEQVTDDDGNIASINVMSFTQDGLSYRIELEDHHMSSCSCRDFQWHRIPCKHMYLVPRASCDSRYHAANRYV